MLLSTNRINRLTSAVLDLENSLRFMGALSYQEYGAITYEALLITAVIFYARPFSANEKKDSPFPSESKVPDIVLSDIVEAERHLHDKLLRLRNKAIAHAEWGHHPTGVMHNGIIKARPFSIWTHFKGNADIEEAKKLTGKVLRSVQHQQANASREFI